MQAVDALEALELLGSSQWGLVTSAQAKAAEIERLWLSRLTAKGTLQRVRHGVYSLPSATMDQLQNLHAAWLSTVPALTAVERRDAADPVVVSGASASAVHQVGDLIPLQHQFTSPERRQTSQSDITFRRDRVAQKDITWVHGLPVTSVPRTIVDLARDSTDGGQLADIVSQALSTRAVSYEILASRLNPYAHRYGCGDGHALLVDLLVLSPLPIEQFDTSVLGKAVERTLEDTLAELRQRATVQLPRPLVHLETINPAQRAVREHLQFLSDGKRRR